MVNKVILVGNVGIDPEVRTLEGGAKVARVRLATTERLYDRASNETKEHTEWHTITLWRGLADVVDRYVRKGTQLYIEGRLRTREWMDKDNNKRYTTEILADTMNLLGRRSERRGRVPPTASRAGDTSRAAMRSRSSRVPPRLPSRSSRPHLRSRPTIPTICRSDRTLPTCAPAVGPWLRAVLRSHRICCRSGRRRSAAILLRRRLCRAAAGDPHPVHPKGLRFASSETEPFFPWWRRPPCASGFTAGPVTEFSVRGVRFPAGIRSDRLRSGRRALR